MRHLFETAARALRGRRELAVAAATAIVAAGAAGLMAGRAERYRLAARDARRRAEELREELSSTEVSISLLSRLVREREEDLAFIERQMRLSLNDSRKAITEYKSLLRKEEEAAPSRTSFLFSEVMRDWSRELDALETTLNNSTQELLVGEQTQLADLYDTEEVNTTDTAAEK